MRYSKTDRVILLIQLANKSKDKTISKHMLSKTLDMSRANFYKTLEELLHSKGKRKAIFVERIHKGKIAYQLAMD